MDKAGRTIGGIIGRQDDYFLTSTGIRVGRMDQVVKYVKGLHGLQIINSRPGYAGLIIDATNRLDVAKMLKSELQSIDPGVEIDVLDEPMRKRSGKCPLIIRT